MVNANFESIFAPYLMNFIAYKQSCGYKYKTETTILKQFDKMCCSLNISEVALTKEIIDKWSSKKPYERNRSGYQKRLSCVRQFALYMQSAGYKAYIPVNLPMSSGDDTSSTIGNVFTLAKISPNPLTI